MKRLAGTLLALTMCAVLSAQTFTIRRPANGSRVRETVAIRIPNKSIPDRGYIGIYVNGKFLEAVLPPVEGDDYVYRLDTKARGIPDGQTTIEAVLYQDQADKPRIINRSSVTVTVDNRTGIKLPEEGVRLRYKFTPGKEVVYQLQERNSISYVSQALAQIGSRGREIPLGLEKFRLMYAIDNAYNTPNGREGLIRIQALPDKGKDYAILTVVGETQPKRYYSHEMHPIYTRITDTGREVFSQAPSYWPMQGSGGQMARFDLFVPNPLPILPTRAIMPGESFPAATALPSFDLDKMHDVDDYFEAVDARGVFEGVEWQSGIPCAKLRTTVAQGAEDLKNVTVGQIGGETQRVEMEQLIWFALDRGLVVRSELIMTQEALVTIGGGSGGGSGAPQGGGNSGGPTGVADAPGVGSNDRSIRDMFQRLYFNPVVENGIITSFFRQRAPQNPPPPDMGSGAGGAPTGLGTGSGPGGDSGGFGNRSGGNASGGGATKQIMRIRVSRVMDLEQ